MRCPGGCDRILDLCEDAGFRSDVDALAQPVSLARVACGDAVTFPNAFTGTAKRRRPAANYR
jgi:hypothetical protein